MIQVKFHWVIQKKLHQVTPATIRNDSFKLIDTLASEGAWEPRARAESQEARAKSQKARAESQEQEPSAKSLRSQASCIAFRMLTFSSIASTFIVSFQLVVEFNVIRPISLIGVIGLCLIASSVSSASLAHRLIGFAGLIGSSTHRLFCERLATAVNKATKITWLNYTASHGVAALWISASEFVNTATAYYAASSLHVRTFARKKICWWLALAKKKMWLWIASFDNPYYGDVLQLAEQLFSLSLPQKMTKTASWGSVRISTHGYQLVT